MPAAVETMMYAGEVPWHGEGTYVGDRDVDSATAIEAAGLDWTVEVQPVYLGNGDSIPGKGAVVRSTDSKVLGVTSENYTPVQNREGFQFMDSLVESGDMRYHTAGSLEGGQKVWALAQMEGGFEVVPGDVHHKFMLLSMGHDGKTAVRVLPTTVRVVCRNTLGAALQDGRNDGISVRHTTGVHANMKTAMDAFMQCKGQIERYEAFAKYLASQKMTAFQAEQFFIDMAGGMRENKKGEMVIKGRTQTFLDLFHGGAGQDIPGVAGTKWAAWNAVTEFANYRVGTKGQRSANFGGVMFGSYAKTISKAADLLVKA